MTSVTNHALTVKTRKMFLERTTPPESKVLHESANPTRRSCKLLLKASDDQFVFGVSRITVSEVAARMLRNSHLVGLQHSLITSIVLQMNSGKAEVATALPTTTSTCHDNVTAISLAAFALLIMRVTVS